MKLKGYRYHHIGIPTDQPVAGECYLEQLKMYAAGFENSRFGVEWLRFDDDCPLPELVKTVPHVAFIEHQGAPVEFLEFDDADSAIWPGEKDPRSPD